MRAALARSKKVVPEFHAIGFSVGEEEYALPLNSLREIITTPRITRVPHAPHYIRGVINLHGNVVPVIDIARRFGIGETEIGEGSRIVVVSVENETLGLLAAGVGKVERFQEPEMQPPPQLVAGISSHYLRGVVRTRGRFLIFLNLERTLAEDDGQEVGTDHVDHN